MSTQKPIDIGWIVSPEFGDFAFYAPETVKTKRSKPLSNRSIQACPAVNELERRLFQVKCPFNLHLQIDKTPKGFDLFAIDNGTRLDDDLIPKFVTLNKPDIWRDPETPVIQIAMPYVFICDESCYMSQLPPFMEKNHHSWPGMMTSGRFQITNWPRILNWAFEWTDTNKSLKLKRGSPLFYVFFETLNPDDNIRLIRAEKTKELSDFRKGINGIPKYLSNTFKIMETAKQRRPEKLLKPADKKNK